VVKVLTFWCFFARIVHMINAPESLHQSPVMNELDNPLATHDVVAEAERLLGNGSVEQELGATAVNASMDMLDPMMQDYMQGLEAMNRNFTTLSADDLPEEGYSQDQVNAIMQPSLTMTTLSADSADANAARQMAAIAHEEHDRRVRGLIDQEEDKEDADA
jgi:hypothetical protein